jgi:phage-related protein (TIGR01555 family)
MPLDGVEKAKNRFDTWMNALTGLGTAVRDKLVSTTFVGGAKLNDTSLEDLYHGEDMAARICEALPEESFRKGFRVSVTGDEDSEISKAVKKRLEELGFTAKALEADIWGRVFGGAALYIGINDGRKEDQPVNMDAIKSIDFINVLDKRDVEPFKFYNDVHSDKYSKPATYRINQVRLGMDAEKAPITTPGAEIHESRLLVFCGNPTSIRRRSQNNGWHESVLQKVHDVLVQFNIGWQSTAHLLQDAAQGVFKVEGLIDMIASGDKEALQSRMELVEMSRSVARAIMLDAEAEDFVRQEFAYTSLAEILRTFMLRLAAAARMPVTVLMGQSPAGLNATGESDLRLWYDRVEQHQVLELKPTIKRFVEILFASQDFEHEAPDDWDVVFNSLWRLNPMEQSELELKTAQKDKIYMDGGVLTPSQITVNRHKSTGFDPETQIDLDAARQMMENEVKMAVEESSKTPAERAREMAEAAGVPGGDDENGPPSEPEE